MIKPNIALAFLLTGLLAACGGDSGDSVVPETGTGTGTGGGTTGGDTDSGGGDAEVAIPQVLQVGSGSGVGFEPGKVTFLSVSEDSTDIDVSVTVTDKNNANTEVAGNYRAEFSATCLTPVNGTDAVVQSDSTLTKRYKNEASCASDTIDVTVYQFSDNTAVGTASGTINSSSPSVETPVPALGYGSGASFREGVISADAFAIVAGSSLSVSITAVDKNKGNALLSGSYRYKFSSTCESSGNAVFSSTSSLLSGGVGAADYINIDCAGTDTITAYLFAPGADASNNANALGSATLTIRTALPKLGTGSGADFIENRISGADSLEGSDSIELTASVVNPLNNNGVISDANYEVKWSTSCASADFTLPEQTLATEIRTRYFGDTAYCLGTDTITLELYERTNPTVILATATKVIAVSLGVDAKLGLGAGLGFTESTLNITPAVLAAGGTALITANIVDGNNFDALVSNKAYGVTISSDCAVQGRAAFTESEKIVFQGEARFSYTAQGCVDADALTVSLYAVTDGVIDKTRLLETATGTITVNKAEIGAILSDEISSQQLSVTSIANPLLPTQAQVSFKVVDKNGAPVADQEVRFSLSSSVGGISLTSPTAITDSDGLVTALVNSGSTHAITSVIAETTTDTGDLLRTSSLPISITTGLPRQDRFSIAVDVFNPAAYNFDGTEVEVTASAADAFGNPVPDGTIVNFSTESGMVVSSCSTTSGRCSAVWTSSGKRPGQFDPSLNRVNERVGFTTIVAYTEGEAGFTDSNGNYMLDANESFVSFDEAFLDENWNSTLDQSGGLNVEPFFDFNQDGLWTPAPSKYQGAACSDGMRAFGHCAERMHVRGITRIVQSMKDSITMRFFSCSAGSCTEDVAPVLNSDLSDPANPTPTNGSFYVVLQDGNENIPASGSTFEATGDGYDVVADKGGVPNSIGLLTQDNPSLAGMTGLPEYGALYQVSYTPEAQAKLIEVTAVSGEKTVTIKLYP